MAFESVYVDVDRPLGLTAFASTQPAEGRMLSARTRAGR